jgi:glycosyltransferase involved in cell wall biosynthesis
MIVIIQPWFSAAGHPAQSLINLAKIVGNYNGVTYLISIMSGNHPIEEASRKLKLLGEVVDCPVNTPSIREGTLKALSSLRKLIAKNPSINSIFFLDAHLVLLAMLWPFYLRKNIKCLGVVYLMGPERVAKFLKRKEVVLFLRTEELVLDWKNAFPNACIKCLPSLEIPFDEELIVHEQLPSSTVRVGVLGQIRAGKSLEWIVPIFKDNPLLGKLTVAGAFSQPTDRERLSVLEEFEGFQEKFLSEQELLKLADEQDYLLMLYDNWDHRMEGAVMFLAARVNRPVIVYNKGWCGRMVCTYKNGLFAPQNHEDFISFIQSLPRYDSDEYRKLLEGVAAFRQAHSGSHIQEAFLEAIFV